MTRRWSILALLLAAAVLTAGCTRGGDEGDPADGAPPGGGNSTTTPPGGAGGNGSAARPASPPPVSDQGAIQGAFEKSWTLSVPAVSPRLVTVLFNLTGAQAGAPPTAKVHLEFVGPDGAVLKSTDAGLGGSGNAVAWTFGPADVAATGDYVVRATQAAAAPGAPGLPSGGIANYQFYGAVEY